MSVLMLMENTRRQLEAALLRYIILIMVPKNKSKINHRDLIKAESKRSITFSFYQQEVKIL